MSLTKIYKRDGTVVSFNKEKIFWAIYKALASVSYPDLKLAQDIADKVINILKKKFSKITPTVENIQNTVEKVLIKQSYYKIAKAYILYREKRRELREKREKNKIENIPYKSIWQTLVWNTDHQCETIEKLNKYVENKELGKLVKIEEKRYDEEILNISSLVKKQIDRIRLLTISGPSSSGKTITTNRLSKELKKKKISLVKLNIDNYFYGLNNKLKDEFDDYDFEGPYALDFPLIHQHLSDLFDGKKIQVPQYDFKIGVRKKSIKGLQLKSDQILLIDSHFGIYPKLTENIPNAQKFKIYLETLCQIKNKDGQFVQWTDIRLLRRMLRDDRVRAYNLTKTVGHWHYLRNAELKNIIPYISTADYVFNTAMAYELPILKHHLFRHLPKIIKIYQKDKKRQDAYFRAKRINQLLAEVTEWSDDKIVPQKSIFKEFIG